MENQFPPSSAMYNTKREREKERERELWHVQVQYVQAARVPLRRSAAHEFFAHPNPRVQHKYTTGGLNRASRRATPLRGFTKLFFDLVLSGFVLIELYIAILQ